MKHSLRWLHLTDLHCGTSEGRRLWPTVKDELFEDLRRLHDKVGPWDLVLFTGDLTQRGSADDFRELGEELDELWEELRTMGSSPALLAVPGNHDLARPDAKRAAVRTLLRWHDDEVARKEFWDDPKSEYRAVVTEAFREYESFVEAFLARHPMPAGFTLTRGVLPGDASLSIEKAGIKAAVVGLNTAFLQLDGGDYLGRLDLDVRQLVGVCTKNPPRWIKQHQFALLMTHHPAAWLHRRALDEFHGNIAPPGRFFAHLFGHMHESRATTSIVGGAEARRDEQGASLLGLDTWGDGTKQRVHGYSAGRIDVEASDAEYRLWPRLATRLQAGGHQFVADPSFRLTNDCTSERFVPRIVAAASSAVVHSPVVHSPVVHSPASPPTTVTTPVAKVDVSLEGGRAQALVGALLAAFPTQTSLARLVRFRLDTNLATIASGNLSDQVFALVEWAEANGRVRDLVNGALGENPGNPTLAAFALSAGVDAPAARPAPTAVVAVTPAGGQIDRVALARELRAALSSLFSRPAEALQVAHDAGLSRARIDFTGPMQTVWFNVIEEAVKSGGLAALIRAAREAYPQDPELARLSRAIEAGAPPAAVTWTPSTLHDGLLKLLPAQFEELVFRLAVPAYYLPAATAPLAERAIVLVRLFEQQQRLGDLGAGLERLGVRPRGQ